MYSQYLGIGLGQVALQHDLPDGRSTYGDYAVLVDQFAEVWCNIEAWICHPLSKQLVSLQGALWVTVLAGQTDDVLSTRRNMVGKKALSEASLHFRRGLGRKGNALPVHPLYVGSVVLPAKPLIVLTDQINHILPEEREGGGQLEQGDNGQLLVIDGGPGHQMHLLFQVVGQVQRHCVADVPGLCQGEGVVEEAGPVHVAQGGGIPCQEGGQGSTLSLVESFIESEVPHLKLFLVKSMMPLKRWVATEKVLTALLGNEV